MSITKETSRTVNVSGTERVGSSVKPMMRAVLETPDRCPVSVYQTVEGRKGMFYLTTHSTHFILRLYGPMKDRSDYPSHHERTLLPRSYISLLAAPM